MEADLSALENAIGRRFHDRELLRRAVTHSSWLHENKLHENRSHENRLPETKLCDPPKLENPPESTADIPQTVSAPVHVQSNEQMEFLGDSVLGLAVSEKLVRMFPHYGEGDLSRVRNYLVSAVHLVRVARKLELGSYLRLGRGEEMSGGREKPNLLADCLEALIAAVYLDGGMEPARALIQKFVLQSELPDELEALVPEGDPDQRMALEQVIRRLRLPSPRYTLVGDHGDGIARVFTIEVRVGRDHTAYGSGASKKGATQAAARKMVEDLTARTELAQKEPVLKAPPPGETT